jgi:glucose-1-phosphate cytidylyltransferase
MQVLILCGGLGTRAYPHTETLPKPMLPIAGKPIVMSVMQIFADQGITDFVLALGYRKEVIEDYFDRKALDWNVQLVDTGSDTLTGGRVHRCRDLLGDEFFVTYADGLANIPLAKVIEFHRSHNGMATMTSVPMPCQYGTLSVEDSGRILAFNEKPILRDHWINAGFALFDRGVFDYWQGENLETEVYPSLAQQGLLYTYRHPGRFKSMDSHKDQQEFEELVRDGDTFWLSG